MTNLLQIASSEFIANDNETVLYFDNIRSRFARLENGLVNGRQYYKFVCSTKESDKVFKVFATGRISAVKNLFKLIKSLFPDNSYDRELFRMI